MISKHSDKSIKTVETDHRFPSGPWTGFWIQKSFGKQGMKCHLSFSEGRLFGAGIDVVGRFAMSGTYDVGTGRCLLSKRYQGAHCVQYEGVCENDELWLWGVWQLGSDRGGFHIWPDGMPDPTRRRLKTRKNISADRPKQLVDCTQIGSLDRSQVRELTGPSAFKASRSRRLQLLFETFSQASIPYKRYLFAYAYAEVHNCNVPLKTGPAFKLSSAPQIGDESCQGSSKPFRRSSRRSWRWRRSGSGGRRRSRRTSARCIRTRSRYGRSS